MLVIVDLDDTLCNTWEAGKSALIKLMIHLIRKRRFRLVKYLLLGKYRSFESIKRYHLLGPGELIKDVLLALYPDIERAEVREMVELVEGEFFSKLRLYPDALPFLMGLKELGAKVALVTDSSSEWQRKKIERLGIAGYFDDIIISGETGHSKLEPHNFVLAVERSGEERVYVVGDRDDTDMRGAKAIGAVGILVRRGYFRNRIVRNADYIVKDLFEALKVIRDGEGNKGRAEA